MRTLFLGQNLIELKAVDSTNNYLAQLASMQVMPEGTVVSCFEQTQGKGQRGNQWFSSPGQNLTISALLYPHFLGPDEQFYLSKAVSLALCEYLTDFLPERPQIKWPNDIYCGDEKIAGILIENALKGNQIANAVVGIGLNVNQTVFPANLRATSLKLASGMVFDLKACLTNLCTYIEARYLQLKSKNFDRIDRDYLARLYRFREWHSFQVETEIFLAQIIDVDQLGKLVLTNKSGETMAYDIKEVVFTP